jgi:hypothetical protein
MRNEGLVLEILRQVDEAATRIQQRFQVISQVSDFTDTPMGIEKMDAICMMLIGKKQRACVIF